MKFVMYQDCLSPHQLPLAREIAKRIGADNFRYVYTDADLDDRKDLGWDNNVREPWAIHVGTHPELAHDLIENAEAMLTMFRDTDLIARRSAKGLKTFYDSERWFKPISIGVGQRCRCSLPGWLKLLAPSYFKMAMKIAALIFKHPNFRYLPIGPHAARDMRLICRVYSVLNINLLPQPTFLPWGYFVEPSNVSRVEVEKCRNDFSHGESVEHGEVKVLYVGRLLKLKHVDTIIRAIALLNSQHSMLNPQQSTYTLTIVGDGPEKTHLQKLASSVNLNLQPQPITFHPSVPISEVRQIMRDHDILVFASDATDGWGAVVNESLSEGVSVIGTYETGASSALLPTNQLFHCGNYKELASKLSTLNTQHSTLNPQLSTIPQDYTPSGAADRLLYEGAMNA